MSDHSYQMTDQIRYALTFLRSSEKIIISSGIQLGMVASVYTRIGVANMLHDMKKAYML